MTLQRNLPRLSEHFTAYYHMSIKLQELADKLNLTLPELREKIAEFGFDVSPKARTIDEEVAELVESELTTKPEPEEAGDVADIYDEMISQQQERELIKKQRKRTAGKDAKKDFKSDTSIGSSINSDNIEIGDVITVKEFSEKSGINVAKIIGELMKNGILANINQQIDFETASIIAEDLGIKLKRKREAAGVDEFMSGDITKLLHEDDTNLLKERPPVVVVMGHVDHGKTQLLDTIRESNVVAKESGGITQHIGAYQVVKKGKAITFLDTPGHEAFTSMRARGAKVTDVAILVVAADEGVKPQTVEAYNHAKEAGVPIIVALNKMDKPDANPDKVKGELSEIGLQPEDWGGNTVVVPVSAIKGDGIDDLLDMILLNSEMLDLKANPEREAVGTVIEAHLDKSLGPVATILVNTGTLKITDNVIVGETFGKIKLMRDSYGKALRIAGPSTPVQVAGLHTTPKSGDILHVVRDEKTARQRAEEVSLKTKENAIAKGMESVISHMKSEKVLKLIVKADTKGSLEAIKQSLAKIKHEDVAVKIIHSGVGTVTETDVMMAAASNGIVMAFHSDIFSPNVKKTAEREHVEIIQYTVIYDLIEDVKKILSGLLEPEILEITIGRANVRQVFLTKKKEMIIGCRVLSGKMQNRASLRIIRFVNGEEEIVGNGEIRSLRKVDEEVKEIGEGNECGIKFVGDVSLEEGDIIEAYRKEEKQRSII